MLAGAARVRARGDAAAGPGRAPVEVELEGVEAAQVQGERAVGGAEAEHRVPAGADGHLGAGVAREPHRAGHGVRVGGTDDRRRALLDAAGLDGPRVAVAVVVRDDDGRAVAEGVAEHVDGDGGGHGG